MSEARPNHSKEAGDIARLLSYILILLAAVGLFFTANDIPTSRFETLGAGAFPKIVFAAIALLSIIAIIDALRKIPKQAYGQFTTETIDWVRRRYLVFILLGALVLYILAIPIAGFSIASFAFIFAIQVVLMPRRLRSIVLAFIIAVVFSFGLNWLFAEVFTVFLPRGVF